MEPPNFQEITNIALKAGGFAVMLAVGRILMDLAEEAGTAEAAKGGNKPHLIYFGSSMAVIIAACAYIVLFLCNASSPAAKALGYGCCFAWSGIRAALKEHKG